MASYFIRLMYIFPGRFQVVRSILAGCMYSIIIEAVRWWSWWTQLFLLKLTFVVGILILPLYINFVVYIDADINVQAPRTFRLHKRSRSVAWATILPLHRKACVFTHVINIHAEHIAFLRRPILRCDNTIAHHCVRIWNVFRQNLSSFPPHGLPLRMTMLFFAILVMMYVMVQGIARIWTVVCQQHSLRRQSAIFSQALVSFRSYILWLRQPRTRLRSVRQMVFQTNGQNMDSLCSEVFDADSDTVIVDNSANCIDIHSCRIV